MKICVLGAGVIGVTTAYFLGRAGHSVTLIDKASSEASGTSRANGAQLSYSYIDPFASPETFRNLPKYFLGREPGLKFGQSLNPAYLSWGLRFLKNCMPAAYDKNFAARTDLAKRSQAAFSELERQLKHNQTLPTAIGKIVVTSSEKQLSSLIRSAQQKTSTNSQVETLSAEDCLKKVPELAGRSMPVLGGVYCKTDRALDTKAYCQALLADTGNADLTTVFNRQVESLLIEDGEVKGVVTDAGIIECDRVIACLGGDTNKVLSAYAGRQPIYPVQGYSLTLPSSDQTPKCSVTDLDHKFVIANLGDRVRIAGFMDVNLNRQRSEKRAKELLSLAKEIWPQVANFNAEPNLWTGQRPMTPSGLPFIGPTKTRGLFLNAGHGSLGYTFATGSAAKILDLIGSAKSEVL